MPTARCPAGESGEIVVRGDVVMAGYWNQPEATAETLRGGWLHTGDVGSFDAEGFLTLHDRSKDLIISGGMNIYPREVEEALLRHPGVAAAAVVGRPDAEWGEAVVAFVVAGGEAAPATSELDRTCLDTIARYKRPKEYRFVDTLPTNNYGKVVKRELRDQLRTEQRAEQRRRPPPMKLALYLPNFRDKVTIKELEELTALAEELDFDSVWTLDRIVVPEASDRQELQYSFGMMSEFPKALPVSARGEWFQGWPLIPWLAAKTSKVRIGMSITDTPYRAPGVLAAEIATVDHLCNGRINVGVGSGWMPEEFAASSAAHIFPKRHQHVRETIEIMKGIWTNELFEYHGEFADFDSCGFGAKPLQDPHPPIFFSGLKDPKRSASRIAKYDLSGWIGIQDTPTELQDWRGAIRRELDELGSAHVVRRPGDLLDDLVRDHRHRDRPDRRRARAPTCWPAPPGRSPTCSSATARPA